MKLAGHTQHLDAPMIVFGQVVSRQSKILLLALTFLQREQARDVPCGLQTIWRRRRASGTPQGQIPFRPDAEEVLGKTPFGDALLNFL